MDIRKIIRESINDFDWASDELVTYTIGGGRKFGQSVEIPLYTKVLGGWNDVFTLEKVTNEDGVEWGWGSDMNVPYINDNELNGYQLKYLRKYES